MKRLIAILCLIPCLCFGAFTEFYTQSGGSNLNAGSTNNNTAAYTSTSGNWSTVTNIFTPTDGSTPASSVAVGDWVSIYNNGASTGVFTARVTAVGAGVNGTITVSATARAGTAPTTNSGSRSLKAGGAWLGPTGSSGVPLNYATLGSATDSSGHTPRINMKNDATYSISTGVTVATGAYVIQGYSSSVGDGGRATLDGSTNNIVVLTTQGSTIFADLIVTSSTSSGTNEAIQVGGAGNMFVRVTAAGARGSGFQVNVAGNHFYECEAYNNNRSNTSGLAGFALAASNQILNRCIASSNTGSNTDGFAWGVAVQNIFGNALISFGNGRHGFSFSNPQQLVYLTQCDAYSNGGDGLKNLSTTQTNPFTIIENCNFVKNTGWGVNSAITTGHWNGVLYNCGFGFGTQVNGSGDTNGLDNLQVVGKVTYASNVTPWVDPTTGNFSINLAASQGTGRGNFTETQGSFSGTVGYPDIGAAQASPAPTCAPTPTRGSAYAH